MNKPPNSLPIPGPSAEKGSQKPPTHLELPGAQEPIPELPDRYRRVCFRLMQPGGERALEAERGE